MAEARLLASPTGYRNPHEVLVKIVGRDGVEEVLLPPEQYANGTVPIRIVQQEEAWLLIELPRETCRGHWRMWVEENSVAVMADA